jgi:predicted RNA-binding Zn-ribbon protein involved in translation (DUF1610 family)
MMPSVAATYDEASKEMRVTCPLPECGGKTAPWQPCPATNALGNVHNCPHCGWRMAIMFPSVSTKQKEVPRAVAVSVDAALPAPLAVALVSASFIQKQRDAVVAEMQRAYKHQLSVWSGVACCRIPGSLSAEEQDKAFKQHQQAQAAAQVAASSAATWAAEQVRKQQDPPNDLGLYGWSIVDGGKLVQRPVPADCWQCGSDYYESLAEAASEKRKAATSVH